MVLTIYKRSTLIERVRWLRYFLPPIIAIVVILYQLFVAQKLGDQFGHLVHYSVEIAFYSMVRPAATWLTLIWVERSLIEKNQLEEKVERSNKQLANLTKISADGIVSLDHAGQVRFWNKGAAKILGYSEASILGKDINSIINLPISEEK
jgi:PAS domain-containing protein